MQAPNKTVNTPGHSSASDLSDKPACPRCGKPMVLRAARKGARAGQSFWGCAAYPDCTGVREVVPA